MRRLTDILGRAAMSLLALALVFQFSIPHLHAAAAHDVEICTGHLGDPAKDDGDDESFCPQCLTGRPLRVVARQAHCTTLYVPIAIGRSTDRPICPPRSLLLTGHGAPRAPPRARARV